MYIFKFINGLFLLLVRSLTESENTFLYIGRVNNGKYENDGISLLFGKRILIYYTAKLYYSFERFHYNNVFVTTISGLGRYKAEEKKRRSEES